MISLSNDPLVTDSVHFHTEADTQFSLQVKSECTAHEPCLLGQVINARFVRTILKPSSSLQPFLHGHRQTQSRSPSFFLSLATIGKVESAPLRALEGNKEMRGRSFLNLLSQSWVILSCGEGKETRKGDRRFLSLLGRSRGGSPPRRPAARLKTSPVRRSCGCDLIRSHWSPGGDRHASQACDTGMRHRHATQTVQTNASLWN